MRWCLESFVGQLAPAFGLLLAHVGDARADVGPLHYSVDPRAKGCPSAAEFLREVERHAGRDDGVDRHPPIDVRIEADARELRAYVEVESERPGSDEQDGIEEGTEQGTAGRLQKVLRAPTNACRDLASAAAMTVSLMSRTSADLRSRDGSSSATEPPADGEEDASRSDSTAVAPPEIVRPRSSPEPPPAAPRAPGSRPRIQHAVHAGAIVGKTMVPDVGVGAIVGYTVDARGEGRRLGFGLTAEASSTAARTAFADRGGGVRVHSSAFSLGPCLHVGQLLSCTMATIGSSIGVGTGVREPERRALVFVEASVRLGARVRLPPPFALRTELRVGAPLGRPRFLIEGDTIWKAPAVTVLGACSLETTF